MSADVVYTAEELREVLDSARLARGGRSGDGRNIPAWGQLALAVLAVVVTVIVAWANLNTRVALIEQKLDYVVMRVAPTSGR